MKTTTDTLEALRDELMDWSQVTAEQADELLATIIAEDRSIPEGKLPALVTQLAQNLGWPRAQVLEWMLHNRAMSLDPVGREVLFAAGWRVALRWGMSAPVAKAIKNAVEHLTVPTPTLPPAERGH